jgi:type VI secretion system secreted protein Hcp
MAVDYFLEIDGVEGESTDAGHKGEIDVLSFSWGLSQPAGAPAGGGGRAGKVVLQDFHFVARVSKASPKLFLAAAGGQHLKSAVLTCRRGGGKAGNEFLVYRLTDVLVSSYQVGGSGSEDPLDQVSLRFGRLEMQYTPTGKTGKTEPSVKAGWDVKTNKKV